MSIEKEIHDEIKKHEKNNASKQLGTLDHYVYGVRADDRIAFVKDLMKTTSYRIVSDYGDPETGDTTSFLLFQHGYPHFLVRGISDPGSRLWAGQMNGKPGICQVGVTCTDMGSLIQIQEKAGILFQQVRKSRQSPGAPSWAETEYSTCTGNSTAYIERSDDRRECYLEGYYEKLMIDQELMEYMDELDNGEYKEVYDHIGPVDHTAYRVGDERIIETAVELFMRTGYRFTESYLVDTEHAKTMVFRRGNEIPALVASYGFSEDSVVSRYVATYGPRVHHTAFATTDIETIVNTQINRNIQFTTDTIVGDRDKGLLQIFTQPSPYSLEIFEYIQRFKGFRGFFLAANVGRLMQSTKQFNM